MEFFGISTGEFLIISLVGLLIVGPNTLASLLRATSAFIKKAKNYSAQLRANTNFSEAFNFGSTAPQNFNLNELNPVRTLKNTAREEADAWAKSIFNSAGNTDTAAANTNNTQTPDTLKTHTQNTLNSAEKIPESQSAPGYRMNEKTAAVFEALANAQKPKTAVASEIEKTNP